MDTENISWKKDTSGGIFYRRIFLTIFFSYLSVYGLKSQTQSDIDTIYKRLYDGQIAQKYDPAHIRNYMNTLGNNGCWPDIDYVSILDKVKSYSPVEHQKRTLQMVLAYCKNSTEADFYLNPDLLAKIILALNDNVGRPIDPIFTWWGDWYAIYINIPGYYAKSLLLLKGKISQTELLRYSGQLLDAIGFKNSGGGYQFAEKGQNTIWVAQNSIYKGCIEDNLSIISRAVEFEANTLKIQANLNEEGIKIDGAWHQHGSQLYCGGYGLWYTGDLLNTINLVEGTSFRKLFSKEKLQYFVDLLLNGHRWFGYRRNMDFGANGRNISRENNTGNISTWVLDKMMVLDPENTNLYTNWKNHIVGNSFSPVTGNRHFWKTDIMVHRGINYYLSAKVISTRTTGTESMNNENNFGYNLPLGATNINTRGGEYNNIYPVWDWSRIPGTTAELGKNLSAGHTFPGTNSFAGGVSDNQSGIISFKSNYQGINSCKSYFFMGDAMFCMGSGITAAKSISVITSINQCFLNGSVEVNNGSTTVFQPGISEYKNLSWIYHDRVGYIFPEKCNVVVQYTIQKGSWSLININGSKTEKSHNVFSAWINHGSNPHDETYQYIVVPDKSSEEVNHLTSNHGFKVARNDGIVQVLRHKGLNIYAAVFFRAGTVTFDDGFELSVDKEAIVMIEKSENNYKFSTSDPLCSYSSVKLTVNSNLSGTGVVWNPTTKKSTVTFQYEFGDKVGKTVSKTLKENDKTSYHPEYDNDNDFIVYPVPISGILNISLSNSLIGGEIAIYNQLGEEIFRKLNCTENFTIDLTRKHSGHGIFTFVANGKKWSRKILVI